MLNRLTDAIGLTDFHNERLARKETSQSIIESNKLMQEILESNKFDNREFKTIIDTIIRLKGNVEVDKFERVLDKLNIGFDKLNVGLDKLNIGFDKLNRVLDKLNVAEETVQNLGSDDRLENAYSENTKADCRAIDS